jgi:deoxyribonuclease IV
VLLGAHVSIAGGIDKAIDRLEEMGGGEAVQIFTQSPRMWRPTKHDPEKIERFKERRQETGVKAVLCHAVYLINLAAADKDIYKKSTDALVSTVDVACSIEADGAVFHIGSHLGAGIEKGLDRVARGVARALKRCEDTNTWVLLENSAGAGGTIGRSISELAVIIDRLDRHPRLGICLDACHLWVSGIDVTDEAALDAVLLEVEEGIGLDRLRALHVNDAKDGLGSNRDRHENIGEGVLGDKLTVFLGLEKLQGLPALLEVPGKDGKGPNADELCKLKDLHARAVGAKAKRRRPSGRSRGTKARPAAARRTRD